MGILKNFIDNYRRKKEKEHELEEDIKVQRRVMEKQKDANDRELERWHEDRRKEHVQKELQQIRKQKTAEMWSSNIFVNNKNLFSNDKCFLGRYY